MNCEYCGKECKNQNSKTQHSIRCINNPHKIYVKSGPRRKTTLDRRLGRIPWNKGKTSLVPAWNKGMTGIKGTPHTKETKKRLSEVAKERNFGGYVQGSGRGKKGWYCGIFCDSSWELAYVIYCMENSILIERNTVMRKYVWEGVERNYLPDFIVNFQLVEIKGYNSPQWEAKKKCNPDVKVLYEEDMKKFLSYVKSKYGKDFIKLYQMEGGALEANRS